MISIPVFALAHLTTKGEGLVGQSAQRGYYYMLSIFLRPVLTVFGLIAGLLLYTVTIFYLNKLFLVATAGTGASMGGFGTLSKIIFSVIYVLIAYIAANTCFKAITHFPDHALDWMSAQGHSTKDLGDPTQVASVTAAAADYIGARGVAGAMTDIAGGFGNAMVKGKSEQIQKRAERGRARKEKAIDEHHIAEGKMSGDLYRLKWGHDPNLPQTNKDANSTWKSDSNDKQEAGANSGQQSATTNEEAENTEPKKDNASHILQDTHEAGHFHHKESSMSHSKEQGTVQDRQEPALQEEQPLNEREAKPERSSSQTSKEEEASDLPAREGNNPFFKDKI